jgi:sulfatase modifying factor 1
MKRMISGFLAVMMGMVLTGCPTPGTTPGTTPVTTPPPSSDYTSVNIGILKYVPAGTFSRDGAAGNNSTVSAFHMSRYEITRAQFAALLGTDPSNSAYSSGTSDPVQTTNWYHAIAFCNKLSLAEGFTPVYSVSGVNFATLTYAAIPTSSGTIWDAATADWSANGYRLPTEMEWMWAAMGATAGTTGYLKAFAGSTGSNAIGDYAVYGYGSGQAGATTAQRSNPAGSKLLNELGLYDMSGNVMEWNWDWYAAYPTGALTDTRGPASGTSRVLHGGDWSDNVSLCAVAARLGQTPNQAILVFGFRVVRP